jgi:hypothetical protein
MGKKDNKNVLIHDDGTIVDNKSTQTLIFVVLCRILTVCLALLGLAAFIKGNF